MPIFFEKSEMEYQLFQHTKEANFEKLVVKLADKIFGTDSVYLDIKKRVKGKEIISIPDGYLIDFTDPKTPKLFVIENEIVSHDPFKHIGSQMLRFVVSFEDAQVEIRDTLMAEIHKDPTILGSIEAACAKSSYRNIDDYINAAVFAPFKGLVVIDEIKPELTRVIEKINANISILELKTFEAQDGSFCFEYDTLYDEYDGELSETNQEPTRTYTPEERKRRRERRAKCDTIIVPAKEEGFNRVFLGEDRWYAIRIGAAMKDRIKYIAGYQVSPISAITHVAEIQEIKPYQDSGKYQVIFKGLAKAIKHIPLTELKYKPQGPVYAEYDKLIQAENMEEALKVE